MAMKKGCEAGKYQTCNAACAGNLSYQEMILLALIFYETPFPDHNNYCFLSFLDTRKKCDDLEGWCVKMDKTKDCCSETIQTKCPGLCDTCPGT